MRDGPYVSINGPSRADLVRGLDGLRDAVYFLDLEGCFTYANKALLALWGKTWPEVIGKSFADLGYPPNLATLHAAQIAEVVRTETSVSGAHRYASDRGANGYYEHTYSPVFDAAGALCAIAGSAREATDKQAALGAEPYREAQLNFALEVAGFGHWELDTSDGSATRSLQHDQIFGYDELLPAWSYARFLEHVLPEDRPAVDAAFQQALATDVDWDFECRIRRADGALRWIWARGRIWVQQGRAARRMLGVVADITERKADAERLQAWNETLEAQVAEHGQQVRDLAQTLTQAEQAVRNRLAHALHDDLQQLLFGAQLRLSKVQHALRKEGAPDLSARLAAAEQLVEQAVAMTRHLAQGLAPPVLSSVRIADVLMWLVMQSAELYGLAVTLDMDEAIEVVDEGIRILVYQVVRELLFNVAKHGGTKAAHVQVHEKGDRLVVTVSDTGRGFDPDNVRGQHDGFGLASMRERIGLIGGELHIDAAVGEGSTITLHLPPQLR